MKTAVRAASMSPGGQGCRPFPGPDVWFCDGVGNPSPAENEALFLCKAPVAAVDNLRADIRLAGHDFHGCCPLRSALLGELLHESETPFSPNTSEMCTDGNMELLSFDGGSTERLLDLNIAVNVSTPAGSNTGVGRMEIWISQKGFFWWTGLNPSRMMM